MIAVTTRLTPDGSFPIAFWMASNDLILSWEIEDDPNVVTQSSRHDKRGIQVTYAFHPKQRDLAMLFKLAFGSGASN